MAQQTAVEWLIEQMLKPDMYKIWPTLLERAKEMEKEQIVDAFYEGMQANTFDPNIGRGAMYYNETYKR